jgi:Zn-dependent protease
MDLQFILDKLFSLPGIILGLTVHEYCHALAAYCLGDRTARDQGRLSFNPLRHIDLIGFLFLMVAGFGWAKPVQFNPQNLKSYRRDKAIIAAAGSVSNFLLALIMVALMKGYWALGDHLVNTGNWDALVSLDSAAMRYAVLIIFRALTINLGLFVFNLIPMPPLDGSHIVFSGLNLRPETEYRIMKIGAPLFFIIILVQNYANITILPINKLVMAILGFLLPEMGFA